MLGTSNYGAQLAAYLGIPYCFAHFITDGQGMKNAIDLYKSEFRPSKNLKKPLPYLKRVHVKSSFVLTFKYIKSEDKVIFYNYNHHDNIYK